MPEALPKNHSSSEEPGLRFQNQGLFSDHFLKARLLEWEEWKTNGELMDILKKSKAIPDPCPSNIRDTIADEFSTAVNVLTPLKAYIKTTDNLIDRIVYKLYGLTDEEIAIVEGKPAIVG